MHTAYTPASACMPCSVSQEHVQDLIASLPPLPERLREEEEEINKTSSCWFTSTLTFVSREGVYIYFPGDRDSQDVMSCEIIWRMIYVDKKKEKKTNDK